jgi:hypothetical protein
MASIYDQLTFNTLRNNQDTNPLPNTQNNSGLAWWMNADRSRYPSPMMPPMLDPTGQMGASNYRAPQGIPFDPAQGNRGRWSQQNVPDERTGIMETIKGWTSPAISFLKAMGGQRSPEKQAAYEAIMGGRSLQPWQTGTYKGNQYGLYNSPSGLKVSSDVLGWGEGYEKNFDSAFGSKSLEEMEQKKLDWAMNRLSKGKAISQRLRDVLKARGLIGGNIGDQRPGKGSTIPIGPIDTGGQPDRPAYTGPRTYDFDPGAHRRAGGNRPDKPGGFTDPGRGSYGPHRAEGGRMAYGGRAGYQEGELVEDEYMAEATPRGMMEENIEEVQGEPTREQLEMIALEIFRLPLEELNEEQLNVVYQAAMEQEPAEEEIQFAAQEGPGQGIASLV